MLVWHDPIFATPIVPLLPAPVAVDRNPDNYWHSVVQVCGQHIGIGPVTNIRAIAVTPGNIGQRLRVNAVIVGIAPGAVDIAPETEVGVIAPSSDRDRVILVNRIAPVRS